MNAPQVADWQAGDVGSVMIRLAHFSYGRIEACDAWTLDAASVSGDFEWI